MIAKEGLPLILGTLGLTLVFAILGLFFRHTSWWIVTGVFAILTLFNLFFFRDPERHPPNDPHAIISPADGTIVEIKETEEPEYFHGKVRQISIFLSVFNVHVNRIPISGKIDYLAYHKGKFLAAFKEKASLDNEQTAIGISDPYGRRVLFKQIAGLIARRIVYHVSEGQEVTAGQRMGLIRYGSRVDVFFDLSARVLVKKGQKVVGGETVLARFTDEPSEETATESVGAKPIIETVED